MATTTAVGSGHNHDDLKVVVRSSEVALQATRVLNSSLRIVDKADEYLDVATLFVASDVDE